MWSSIVSILLIVFVVANGIFVITWANNCDGGSWALIFKWWCGAWGIIWFMIISVYVTFGAEVLNKFFS